MHICHPSYDREHRVRRTMLHACLGNKQTLSLKRVGETEGVCEAVEHQPSKHKSQYILKTKKKESNRRIREMQKLCPHSGVSGSQLWLDADLNSSHCSCTGY
jgi:hypothetical protein